ncbi:UNVERIFIED_CONTAM: hypothetical protein Sradi_2158800 [Sesamum radiatum]|uniref:Transducin/WD40 repeat-like superfamily protein n=1 Tax=Sesamum radiatum TaxID=300843 RepID=A0AAW2T0G9_SESRA
MASLHKLLSEEGFEGQNSRKPKKKVKFKDRSRQEDSSIALPIYVCHDRRSFDSSRQRAEKALSLKGSSVFSSRRGGSGSERSNPKSVAEGTPRRDEPAIDGVAVKAMFSILSGYVGQYLSDENFRQTIREKCRSCFEGRKKKQSDNEIFAHLELGIQSIERLVESRDIKKEMDLESLQKSIKILNIVASLDSNKSSINDSYLSACAHLYLSIVYKIAKNDKIAASHLLQIWFNKELDVLATWGYADKDKKIKALNEQYNCQMDTGTAKFALYYKDWLRFGGQAPPTPSVPLPWKPTYARSRRKSSDSCTSFHSTSNKALYQAVFGPIVKGGSMDLDNGNEDSKNVWDLEKKAVAHRRSSSLSCRMEKADLWPDSSKSDYFRFLACRTESTKCLVQGNYMSNNETVKHDANIHFFELNDTTRAISTICSSESLRDCEMAIRTVSEAWLNSHGDKLDVSIRLLRSSSLFLKAAALLYLVKPKAKQMISLEWVPLVLRVLEFGDQLQTLFSVRCIPYEAAYYFLDQLLTGFDEDKNLENAKQIILVGGLSLLVRRMGEGNSCEKSRAASVLHYCIQADGSCRHYLAKNLKKETVVSLLVLERQSNSHALALLTELLRLSWRNGRIESLTGLIKGWDCLNTMHILLFNLQKARPKQRLIIAVILLQLDLMGDPLEHSVYREEAVDAIVKALDCWVLDEKVQEQSARALSILGGHFSYSGEPEVETWLLRKAALNENTGSTLYTHMNEEDKTMEIWQRKTALALLTSGNRRLIAALSNSMAHGIPCLARASLATVCWISSALDSLGIKTFVLQHARSLHHS